MELDCIYNVYLELISVSLKTTKISRKAIVTTANGTYNTIDQHPSYALSYLFIKLVTEWNCRRYRNTVTWKHMKRRLANSPRRKRRFYDCSSSLFSPITWYPTSRFLNGYARDMVRNGNGLKRRIQRRVTVNVSMNKK